MKIKTKGGRLLGLFVRDWERDGESIEKKWAALSSSFPMKRKRERHRERRNGEKGKRWWNWKRQRREEELQRYLYWEVLYSSFPFFLSVFFFPCYFTKQNNPSLFLIVWIPLIYLPTYLPTRYKQSQSCCLDFLFYRRPSLMYNCIGVLIDRDGHFPSSCWIWMLESIIWLNQKSSLHSFFLLNWVSTCV